MEFPTAHAWAAIRRLFCGTGFECCRTPGVRRPDFGLTGSGECACGSHPEPGRQEEALSEQYDSDVLNVQSLEGKVAQAAKQVAQASAQQSRRKTILQKDAINAYVQGGASALTSTNNPLTSATDGLLRAEYANSLATDQSEAIDQYHAAALQDQAAKADCNRRPRPLRPRPGRSPGPASCRYRRSRFQGTLNQDKGRIAVLVAQQQAAAAAAAEAAARARLAAQQAAQQAAAAQATQQAQQAAAAQQAQQVAPSKSGRRPASSRPRGSPPRTGARSRQPPAAPSDRHGTGGEGGRTSASTVHPRPSSAAPPRFSGAGGAVAAAESKVGDPYVCGAAGPNSSTARVWSCGRSPR